MRHSYLTSPSSRASPARCGSLRAGGDLEAPKRRSARSPSRWRDSIALRSARLRAARKVGSVDRLRSIKQTLERQGPQLEEFDIAIAPHALAHERYSSQ